MLCGDLYADKGKRGASGTPLRVWQRFSAYFGSTVGIAGNHDDFGLDLRVVQALANTHLLVQGTVHAQGLRVSGQSGIIGRPDKNFRFPEATYLQGVTKLLRELPDLLLTHLSPHLAEQGLLGEPKLTALLTQAAPTLVLCGHSHWPTPYPQVLANGTQVLNADTKVFILTRA